MISAGTALLFHVCAKHGVIWQGVGAAWMVAAIMDFIIVCFALYCIFTPKL